MTRITIDMVLLCISEVLHISKADMGSSPEMYRTPGWDSLSTIQIIERIEEDFKVVIKDDDVAQCTSLSGIYNLLRTEGGQ